MDSCYMSYILTVLTVAVFSVLLPRVNGTSEDTATLLTLRSNGFPDAAFAGDATWDVTQQSAEACGLFAHVTCNDKGDVTILDLSGLGILGQLDPIISKLRSLEELRIGSNRFYGPLPGSLGGVGRLAVVAAERNSFEGKIPESLGQLDSLKTLNLSSNSFSGPIPALLKNRFCYDVFANNPAVQNLSSSDFPPCQAVGFVASPPPPIPSSGGLPLGAVVGGAVGASLFALLLLSLSLLLCWRRRVAHSPALSEEDLREIEEGLEKFNFSNIRRFSLEELQVATSHWATELGSGGSSIVYRGTVEGPGGGNERTVAVKRAKGSRVTKEEMLVFCNEMDAISRAVHRNVIQLEGYCIDEGERILLFPFMENGSVEGHLRGHRLPNRKPLSLLDRHQIAMGAARGLMYLHEECSVKIIHRDVKAANVLLSSHHEALLTDFGLAKLAGAKEERTDQTKVRGTFGHIAPEYISAGRLSEKADVYAYGVFLLELVTGLPAASITRFPAEGEDLKDWLSRILEEDRITEIVDVELRVKFLEFEDGEFQLAEIVPLVQVAVVCLIPDPDIRPSMADCLRLLQGEGLLEAREKIRQEVPESVLNWNPTFGECSSLSQSLMSFMTEMSYTSEVALELHEAR